MSTRSLILAALLAGSIITTFAPCPVAAHQGLSNFEIEVQRLEALAKGSLGVSYFNVDTGDHGSINGDIAYPMASAFKVAVAGAVLNRVDQGKLTLDQMVAVDPQWVVPPGAIAQGFAHAGIALSVENLIENMLAQSDNSATNVLVDLVGGPRSVNDWLRQIGVHGQRVDRNLSDLLRDLYRLPPGPIARRFEEAQRITPDLLSRGRTASPDFDKDPRDTSTPKAMTLLLRKILVEPILTEASRKTLIGAMERCQTGAKRIRAFLPPYTKVANKTGTISGSVNDVGVITLPNGHRVIVSILLSKSQADFETREVVVAHTARLIYDDQVLKGHLK